MGRMLTALGAGVTTFLLVAVLVIESLAVEFSAIVGLPIGLLAGLAVAAGLWQVLPAATANVSHAAAAYATFGPTVLVLFVLRYVNIGRDVLSVDVMVVVGVIAAIVVFVLRWEK